MTFKKVFFFLRSGMVLRPDIFIGALIGALTAITAAAPLTLLRALPRRTAAPLIRTTCGVLLGLTLIGIVYGVVGVGVGGGYSKERPKRLFIQQILRIDHDVGGAEFAREATLWLNGMDINGLDPLIPHVPTSRHIPTNSLAWRHSNATRPCIPTSGAACSAPWLFPLADVLLGAWTLETARILESRRIMTFLG